MKREASGEEKKATWSLIAPGLLFFFYGVAALVTGQSVVDVPVEGLNVRIGGALAAIVGAVLVVLGLRKK